VEIVNLHLAVYGRMDKPEFRKIPPQTEPVERALLEKRGVYFTGSGWLETPVYDRLALCAGAKIKGPAILEEKAAAALIGPDDRVCVDDYGNLVIELEVKQHGNS
jgi:N-methylhydantoinase A